MTDWEFVFDGVVGFLTSPMWNIPIVSFIEKHCIVFDTSDENMLVLTEIHKEYSSLVEELLTSYLKDVGISEEQFVLACEAGSTCNDQTKVADRSIFEQVWAGEDFELFKSMMVKKNLDLELQALHMIQQRNGVVPKVFKSEIEEAKLKTSKSSNQHDEEKLLKEVIKLSEQEYQKEKDKKKEIERMEKTLALSSKEESERLFQMAEDELRNMERMVSLTLKLEANCAAEKSGRKTLKTESPRAKDKSDKVSSPKPKPSSSRSVTKSPPKEKTKPASSSSPNKNTQPASSKKTEAAKNTVEPTKPKREGEEPKRKGEEPKRKGEEPKSIPAAGASKSSTSKPAQKTKESPLPALKKPETAADAAKNWLSSAMAEANTPSGNITTAPKTGEEASIDDKIAQRAQYMKMQREKLLNLKKQERTKRLNIFEEDAPKRPMSSRVARRVTAGTEAEKPKANEVDEQQQKKLELRRALAARLKKEVVNAE